VRVQFVELEGFRGFKERTRFDIPPGFAVLTGRNGSGKSTVLDAIDFALTGTINKYSVRTAKVGGLDEHIWWVGEGKASAHYVAVGFSDDDQSEFVVTRRRDGGLDASDREVMARLCDSHAPANVWSNTFVQTSLIRDETISALSMDLPEQARAAAVRDAIGTMLGPDEAKRTASLLDSAEALSKEQSKRVLQAQFELSRALSGLTEARSLLEGEKDIAEAERVIRAIMPNTTDEQLTTGEALRNEIAERKRRAATLGDLVARADEIVSRRAHVESEAFLVGKNTALEKLANVRRLLESSRRALDNASSLESLANYRNNFAHRMATLLDVGEAVGLLDGHCPLCAAPRTPEEFLLAIRSSRLGVSRERTAGQDVQRERDSLSNAVRSAAAAVLDAESELNVLEEEEHRLILDEARLFRELQELGQEGSSLDLDRLRNNLLQNREETARLEHAMFVLESSTAHDRVMTLEARTVQLRDQLERENGDLAATERVVEIARRLDRAVKEVANQLLSEQFDTVLPLLKELYQRLRPHAEWSEIDTDFGGHVRASLNFTVGDGVNPQFLFSSGQRRAAGLAFLLAIHLSRPWCRLHSLFLDDPVQHIDDYRALNLAEVLSAIRKTDRQIIVAVEDAALADLLCRRLRSKRLGEGRRFDLGTSKTGSATIQEAFDVPPLPSWVLETAELSA